MIKPLDVFRLINKEGVWVDCTESLPEALSVIRKSGPGEYLVFSQTTQHKQFYKVALNGEVELVLKGALA